MGDVLQGMALLACPCGNRLWSRVRRSLFIVLLGGTARSLCIQLELVMQLFSLD